MSGVAGASVLAQPEREAWAGSEAGEAQRPSALQWPHTPGRRVCSPSVICHDGAFEGGFRLGAASELTFMNII